MKNKKEVVINTNFKDLMYYWLKFIKPFHNLPEQPMRILALVLYYYFEYKEKITDDEIIWKMIFEYDTKVKILNELNIKNHTLENKFTDLRKRGVIKNNTVDKKFIPDLNINSKEFQINFRFNIKDD